MSGFRPALASSATLLPHQRMVGAIAQASVIDATDLRMTRQAVRNVEGVFANAVHAQGEILYALLG